MELQCVVCPTWWCVHQLGSFPDPVVQGVFMEELGITDNELHLPPPPPYLEDRGGKGLKVRASNHNLIFRETSPHPEAIQEPTRSHLIRKKIIQPLGEF